MPTTKTAAAETLTADSTLTAGTVVYLVDSDPTYTIELASGTRLCVSGWTSEDDSEGVFVSDYFQAKRIGGETVLVYRGADDDGQEPTWERA